MKLIKSSVEILDPTGYTIDDIYKSIELAGRTCYKSSPKYRWYTEDKKLWINEDSEEWKFMVDPKREYPIKGENISAKEFVNRMIKLGHGAMLEHGTIYLKCKSEFVNLYIHSEDGDEEETNPLSKYNYNSFSVVNEFIDSNNDKWLYVTTNYRVLHEHDWLNDLKYLCEPTEYHEKRITVRFILPISISREFCRHRCMSLAEQSTRFCNFSLDKFDRGITFIIPYWSSLAEGSYILENANWINKSNGTTHEEITYVENLKNIMFLSSCYDSETNYLSLIAMDRKPQEAREVLSLCTKTELVMTGTISQWQGFFKLRCDKAAHPQARELATKVKEEFIKRGYINEFE